MLACCSEPITVVEKGIHQAYEIQRRLKVGVRAKRPSWAQAPSACSLRLLEVERHRVTTFGRTPEPYLNSDLIEAIGARYLSTVRCSDRGRREGIRTIRPHL